MWPRSRSGEQLTSLCNQPEHLLPSPPAPNLAAQASLRGRVLPAARAAHLPLVCSVPPDLWLPSLLWLREKLLGDYFRATEQRGKPWHRAGLHPCLCHRCHRCHLSSVLSFQAHSKPNPRALFPFLLPFPAVLGMSSEPPQPQLDFHNSPPGIARISSCPWADPCWKSGRSFPHLSSSWALAGALGAECSSRWRQEPRECSSGSGRMLRAVGHSLQRAGSRTSNSAFGCGFSSRFLSIPGVLGAEITWGVFRGGCFVSISAFWDPGTAQVGHLGDLGWVYFPFLAHCGRQFLISRLHPLGLQALPRQKS